MLIDSHCHLKKAFEKGEGELWLERALELGVEQVITVGTGHDDWDFYYQLAKRYSGKIFWTVGIHPCDVNEDWADHAKTIPTYFGTDPLPVALGEIGLDYFHLPKYPDEAAEIKQRQMKAFQTQLSIAYQLDCPVVIHSRNAFHDCVKAIDESGVSWKRVVFHCFAEGPEEMKILNGRGGRGSFTGILTYKNKSADPIRDAAIIQGLDRFMVETDSPYLTPEPKRGNPNEPGFTRYIADYAAELFQVELKTLAEISTQNTRCFFGLPNP